MIFQNDRSLSKYFKFIVLTFNIIIQLKLPYTYSEKIFCLERNNALNEEIY